MVVAAGRFALGAALLVFAGAVAWAGRGLRGTDQYWYAADLVNADTLGAASNQLYPSFSLSGAAGVGDLPPRIHNVPASWVAEGLFQLGASDYQAWLILNAVLALGTATACFVTARTLGLGRAAVWAPALFLAFPLTSWLTLNALAEMSIAFLASLLMVGLVTADRSGSRWGLLLAAVSSGLLFWTRENFVLAVGVFVVFCAWLRVRRHWPLRPLVLCTIGALGFLLTRSVVFDAYPTAGLKAALMATAPGTSRPMGLYYGPVEFHLGPFVEKLVSGAVSSVIPSEVVELVTESSLIVGALIASILAWRRHGNRTLVALLVAMLGVYVATCMLYQSQNRYLYVVAPIAAVAIALAVQSMPTGRPRIPAIVGWVVCGIAVVGLLGGSLLMAREYRNSASAETQAVATIRDTLSTTEGPLLATGSNAAVITTSYSVAPRVVLVADSAINSTAEVATLLDRWGARALLGPSSDGPFLAEAVEQAFPGAELSHKGTVDTPGGALELWSVTPSGSADR